MVKATAVLRSIAYGAAHLLSLGRADLSAEAAAAQSTLIHSAAFAEHLDLLGPGATVEELAVTKRDVQYLGIAVDESTGDVFFATSNSALRRARYSSSEPASWQTTTVIGGSAKVQVSGYNLGASLDDVVSFSIRGVECSNLRRESSNRLLCVSGDLAITNLGEDISTDDIVVQTVIGGRTAGGFPGAFVDAKLADHSLKPIITRVEATSRGINPRAICFDAISRYLYYSDIDTRSIERIRVGEGSVVTVEYDTFLPDVGLVYGMAVDAGEGPSGGFLYFTDAREGTVSRVQLSGDDQPRAPKQILVSGVTEPRGVALEPNGSRLFFVLNGGSIRAVARDGSTVTTVPRTVQWEGGGYEVRRLDSGTRLHGIAISTADDADEDPTELRLYWSESGRKPALKRSSLDGTRSETVLAAVAGATGDDERRRLLWPQGLAFGAGASAGLLYCERLGAVRVLVNPAEATADTVVEEDSYPAAVAIRTLITRAEKQGLTEKYFTSSVS